LARAILVQMGKARVKIDGMDKLIYHLQTEPVYRSPWKQGLRAAVNLGVSVAGSRAPVRRGKLAKSVRGRLQPGKMPLWAIVSAGATNKGFRYGFALEAGHGKRKGGREYQFHRAGGGEVKGWFSGTLDVIQRDVNSILSGVASAIEGEWGK
jgi:hypothetical protein